MLSTARAHYLRQLKARAWSAWYLMYWEGRKEWRLLLRAECHDRLRLWLKTVSAWKSFVLQARVKRARSEKATTHYHFTLRWKVWIEWRRVAVRLAQQRSEVLAFRAEWLVKRSFTRWRAAMEGRQVARQLEDKADTLRDLLTRRHVWRQWRQAMTEASRERMLRKRSDRFFADLLCRRSLRLLTEYVGRRRRQRTLRARADRFQRISCTSWAMSVWIHRTRRSLAIRKFEDKIVALGRRCQMRRVLLAFVSYVAYIREGQRRLAVALENDEHRLKRKAFRRVRLFQQMKLTGRDLREKAQELRSRIVLRRSFSLWLQRVEYEAEKRMMPLYRRAEQFQRSQLKRRFFDAWFRLVEMRRRRDEQIQVADQLFTSRAIPKYFSRWKLFTSRRRVAASRKELAERFRRNSLLLFALYRWRQRAEGLQEERYNLRVAVLHEREVLLSRSLSKWQARTRMLIWDREKSSQAAAFERSLLLRRCLSRWREATSVCLVSKCALRKAVEFRRISVLRTALTAWKTFSDRSTARQRSWERVTVWFDLRRKRKVMEAWKTMATERRAVLEEAHRRGRQRDEELCRRILRHFVVGVRIARMRRLQIEAAESHYRIRVLHKVLAVWRQFAVFRAQRRCEEHQQLQSVRLTLQEGLARRVLAVWSRRRDEKVLERLALARAAVHHRRRTLTHYLSLWRVWVAEKQKQRLRERQAAWFSHVRLLGGAWRVWRQRVEEERQEREDRRQGLVIWAVQLQKRVLTAWRIWVMTRRMVKEREIEAMVRYRQRLLRVGVLHWFRCADKLRLMRSAGAEEESVRHQQRNLNLVRPFALRWKEKALGRKPSVKVKEPAKRLKPHETAEISQTARPLPLIPDFLRASIERDFPPPNHAIEFSCPAIREDLAHPPHRGQSPSSHPPHRGQSHHPPPPSQYRESPSSLPLPGRQSSREKDNFPSDLPTHKETETGLSYPLHGRHSPHPPPPSQYRESPVLPGMQSPSQSPREKDNFPSNRPTHKEAVTDLSQPLLPPSFFAVRGGGDDELRQVCSQLRELREMKLRLRNLKRETKKLLKNGCRNEELEREMEDIRKKIVSLNPNALLDRAKQLLHTVPQAM